MSLSTRYEPQKVEGKWYDYWMENQFFRSVPDEREPYTIVIPPPNVTGVLHMGHMLNNTIQDVLIRRARMQGKNACWVPGTDHASIATEAKVVKKLREELGVTKWEIGREKFLEHAFKWKEEYGGVILQQLRVLGASCDWDRTRFTMEPKLSKAVQTTFIDLYKKGHVYKGLRMTNWDPAAKTAISDEEVYHEEKQAKLYHVRYKIEGTEDEWITIATTRPETILGDTAICFHPEDERYQHLKGKHAIVPMVNRPIPFIFDDYVDMEFGTGALKITPAHDVNDNEIGKRHNLEVIDILNEDGTLSEAAQHFVGEDRFKARKLVANWLEENGQLVKVEEIKNKIGKSERTHVVIEPRLTKQWFLRMPDIAKPALDSVMEDVIEFFPKKYKNVYRHWMENIRDWCISRQLWWGQQIPAYYVEGTDEIFVAMTAEEALADAQQKLNRPELTVADLKRDEDVFDTWFSSWLWPISVFDGFEKPDEVDYYYPTNVLVTGWDIIFFWVARMIMAGYEWRNEKPFKHVYFTGMVRDPKGQKMSKSLGNSPDPLELMEKFGADGVRMGMLMCSPAGGDLLFDEKLCEQGSMFSNKIWNALRLIKGWEVRTGENAINKPAIEWFENRFNQVLIEVEAQYAQYRISEALKTTYSFIWNDFFSSYLEMIKPPYGDPIDEATYTATVNFFEKCMQILHPIMPFITEEVYQQLRERDAKDSICVSTYPSAEKVEESALAKGETAKELITQIRNVRAKNGLSPKHALKLYAKLSDADLLASFQPIISNQTNLSVFEFVTDEVADTTKFLIGKNEFFIDLGIEIDKDAERAKIEEELNYLKGFEMKIQKKLSNERFVSNAPEAVVAKERQKMDDAIAKIKILEESLITL